MSNVYVGVNSAGQAVTSDAPFAASDFVTGVVVLENPSADDVAQAKIEAEQNFQGNAGGLE